MREDSDGVGNDLDRFPDDVDRSGRGSDELRGDGDRSRRAADRLSRPPIGHGEPPMSVGSRLSSMARR